MRLTRRFERHTHTCDDGVWHVFSCVSLARIYYWYDERGKKTKCTAPQYVDFVMSLCQKLVTDEEIFPTKYGECPPAGLLCPRSCCWPLLLQMEGVNERGGQDQLINQLLGCSNS